METKGPSPLLVFVALLALTATTVGVSALHFGRGTAVALALGVAAVKAALIGWNFMDVRSAPPLVRGVVLVGVSALVVLVVGLAPDVGLRLP
jgi:caa(3)-type oxidase subunit IV